MERLITSIMTPNAFPAYTDGDVLIVITPDQQYQLHSQTLRNNSDSFRELLTEDKAVVLASKAKKNGVKVRWRQQLKLRGEGDADAAEHVEGEEHASGVGRFVFRIRSSLRYSTLHNNHLLYALYQRFPVAYQTRTSIRKATLATNPPSARSTQTISTYPPTQK